MPDTTALVTGGAGFIGSHLVEHLLDQGHRVVIVDNLSTGQRENVASLLSQHCQLIDEPLGEALDQRDLLEGIDMVFHLAATVGVKLVVSDPLAMIDNNVSQTAALLEHACKRRVPVLIASSSEVYGKNPSMPVCETDDLLYGPTTAPRWAYGLSKALDEHMALAHHRQHHLPTVITRFFNTIGPRQVGQYGMVVPRFVQRAVCNQPLQVYGDGTQTRAFCDVRDVVRAMVDLLSQPANHGQVFNVGSDREITINDLAQLIIDQANSDSTIEHVPFDAAYDQNFEDLARRVPDTTRLCEAIGFEQQFTLEQTLDELIQLAKQEI